MCFVCHGITLLNSCLSHTYWSQPNAYGDSVRADFCCHLWHGLKFLTKPSFQIHLYFITFNHFLRVTYYWSLQPFLGKFSLYPKKAGGINNFLLRKPSCTWSDLSIWLVTRLPFIPSLEVWATMPHWNLDGIPRTYYSWTLDKITFFARVK